MKREEIQKNETQKNKLIDINNEVLDTFEDVLDDIIIFDEEDENLMHGACPPSARCKSGYGDGSN